MSEHKIIVEFTGDGGGSLPGPTEVKAPGQQSSPTQIPKSPTAAKQAALTTMLQRSAKQIMSYTIGNVGNFTGDYMAQNQINNAMEIAGYVAMIAVNPIVGVPAAVASVGFKAYNQQLQYKRSDREASRMRELYGGLAVDGSRKGGRYT
jgi:hypothetical protein